MSRLGRWTLVCAGAISTVAAARFGGWAVVTVENPPDGLVAGRPTEITFTVRQHGMTLLSDLHPGIVATSGSLRISGRAWPLVEKGGYRGSITVPDTGSWQITIQSGFGRSQTMLLPISAVTASQRVVRLTDTERGRRLFAAKGCVTCHFHSGVGIQGELQIGPNLTDRRFPAEYLAQFLADPSIKPPTVRDFRMPNLNLKTTEIAALVAFINSDRRLSNR